MAQTEQTEIRGTPYRLFRLPPLQGGRVATRVGQLLAAGVTDTDALQAMVKAFKDRQATPASAEGAEAPQAAATPLDVLADDTKLLTALAGGLARVDGDALYTLAVDCVTGNLFADTRKLHDTAAMNAWFEEHPDHLLLVLVWALKANCAGFFGKGGPVLK